MSGHCYDPERDEPGGCLAVVTMGILLVTLFLALPRILAGLAMALGGAVLLAGAMP